MLNVLHLLRKVRKTPSFLISTRSFLSEAFNLNEAWDNRLNSPTIKKINLEALYYELDSQYSRTRKLSAVDVDIFINGLTDETYITEAEELIYRLRTTAETHSTLPTTHHAVIRLFMSTNQVDTLMRILNDRLNYGIFPDDYCYLYMMNHFLKRKDYKNAAKIASLPMLQEDFSHPLVRQFSLYSTYNYLLNRSSWEEQTVIEEKTEEEDDEEEIKIRVKYIRNPFFDDHFDLTDPNHICGKTLYMIGNRFTDAVGRSYCIMGLALYNKWEKLDKYLNGLVQSKEGSPIYSECIGFTENVLNEKCSNDLNINIKEKISQLPTVNGGEQCLIKLVEDDLKHLVQQLEPQEIEEQKQVSSYIFISFIIRKYEFIIVSEITSWYSYRRPF